MIGIGSDYGGKPAVGVDSGCHQSLQVLCCQSY